MICMNCQHEMNPQERFCSRCGKDSLAAAARPAGSPRVRNWDNHVTALGWIFIVSSIFTVIPGLFLMVLPGLISSSRHTDFPSALFFAFGFPLVGTSIGSVVAGIGLLHRRDWARILALILAALMLTVFPFGTAIGIYAFWVLLSKEGSRSDKSGYSSAQKSLA